MSAQSIHAFKIFYCYAHEDDVLREQLARHLSPLRRLRYITGWFDRDIQVGTDWERESEAHLNTANIILLLISADFFASDYCYTIEMQRALEKHRAGTAYVIPILLRPVEWKNTPIGELSALPVDKIPVTQWADQDKAWHNVVQGISEVIKKLLSKQQLSLEDVDILSLGQGPLSGQTVGNKYLLGELVGEGGFSQVYKAQHLQLQRQQAIKVLLERHFRKPEFRDRFLREAQTVASLDHSHIIRLDDFWVEASQAYLVMPFISGGTLQDILEKQRGFLPTDHAVFYLEQICVALDYAHEQGVVHLDLKPLNLLVHKNGSLLLSDFGLAHLMKQGGIEGGSSLRIGTPHYMAPEHIRGNPERRSDLFALGVILYQMLLGRLPFQGLPPEAVMLKNITEWPSSPRSLRPELRQEVEDVLGKALAKQPEQRYQKASDLLIAFKNALVTPAKPSIPSSRLDQVALPKVLNPARVQPQAPLPSPHAPLRRSQLRLDVAQLTDIGRKLPHNKDNMAHVIPLDEKVMVKKGAIFIVADGIHEYPAGEVASEIVVDTVSRAYYEDDNEDVAVSLVQAIKHANALISQRAAENIRHTGMGTTCVVAVLRGNTVYIGNVGNSRAYLVRNGQIRQISQDHSWVEEQVRNGLLTRNQSRAHAQRNVLTRSLNAQTDVDVDVFIEQLFEGDIILLCSDGLYGLVAEDDLRTIVGKSGTQESVYQLVERANENGGDDNITAIVVHVQTLG